MGISLSFPPLPYGRGSVWSVGCWTGGWVQRSETHHERKTCVTLSLHAPYGLRRTAKSQKTKETAKDAKSAKRKLRGK